MNSNKKQILRSKYNLQKPQRKRDQLPWTNKIGYSGLGGHKYHDTDKGTDKTPTIFVHGNTRSSRDWDKHMEYLINKGYKGDELWAITFRLPSSLHSEMANQLDDFFKKVKEYTGRDRFSVVAHSLGVTGTRQWIKSKNRYENIKNCVFLAGANHGLRSCKYVCRMGLDHGIARPASFIRSDYERFRSHPLKQLNKNEAEGDINYYTIRGENDDIFIGHRNDESPVLNGAEANIAIEEDHKGVKDSDKTKNLIHNWIQ